MTTQSSSLRLLTAVLACEELAASTFEDLAKRYGEGAKGMVGSTPEERAAVASWVEVSLEKTLGGGATEEEVRRVLGEMDRVLKGSSFLASAAKETAADVAVLGALNQHLPKLGGGEMLQNEFPNVARWAMQMQEAVARRLGLGSFLRFATVGTVRSVAPPPTASPANTTATATAPAAANPSSSSKEDKKNAKKEESAAAAPAKTQDAESNKAKKNKEQPTAAPAPAKEGGAPPEKKASTKAPATSTAASGDGESSAQFVPSMLDVRVGKILTAKKHAETDNLYIEEIDLGEKEGPRTICSGLVKYYATAEELVGKPVLVVCNLKPRNMKGVDSNGMVLAASNADKSKVELVSPPPEAKPGDKVVYVGAEGVGEPLAPNIVNKKKVLEEVLPGWISDEKGHTAWKDAKTGKIYAMEIEGKGKCTTSILSGTVG